MWLYIWPNLTARKQGDDVMNLGENRSVGNVGHKGANLSLISS
jgi:hypothetical protein